MCCGRILSCEEEKGSWEEYNMEKRESGSNIICPIVSRLLGRMLSGEKKKEILGKKIKILKMWVRKNIKL